MSKRKSLPVHVDGKFSYKIVWDDDLSGLLDEILSIGKDYGRLGLVSDSTVAPLYQEKAASLLREAGFKVFPFTFPAGEENKDLSTVMDLYEGLIGAGFDRHDLLIALGGGVTGDLTGFTAATYLRGIDFIQVPTTLLAMADSSIGGKTGVDFRSYKNMVGAFYMPKLVYTDLSTLKTLSDRQFRSGMAEVIKSALIRDRDLLTLLKTKGEEIRKLTSDPLMDMIYSTDLIKRDVVEEDPTERGVRAILNFGHTIGHAVEKLSGFRLLHGEAVAIGMGAAIFLSVKKGLLSEEDGEDALSLIRSYGLPIKLPKDLPMDPEEILLTTKADKKMDHGQIRFILLRSLGDALISRDVTDDDLRSAIQSIL